MASLLSSRDGVEVVAALLGHTRSAPAASGNVRVLDRIFDEVVDSLRMGLPLRAEIEAGASAVASVLNALQEISHPTHERRGLPVASVNPSRPLPPHFPNNPRTSQEASSRSTGSAGSLPGTPRPVAQQSARHNAQRVPHTGQPQLATTHAQQLVRRHLAQYPQSQSQPQQHVQQPPPTQQQFHAQLPITCSNAVAHQTRSAETSCPPSASTSQARPRMSGQPSLATDATTTVSKANRAPPARRTGRKKRYHDASPSSHCHVCCRPSSAVPVATCSNFEQGTCRKVVCNRCIVDNGWNWEEANSKSSTWICPHCTDSCTQVPRAQCYVYMRTNSRRRMNGLRNKRMRTAEAEPTTETGSASMSPGMPVASNGAESRNGGAQTPEQEVAPYGLVRGGDGAYPMDYQAVGQPAAAVRYGPVHGERAPTPRQNGENAGGPQPNRRGG